MQKRENVDKRFVQDYLKICLLVFTSLKMHWNSKDYQVLVEKSTTSSCTALLHLEWCLAPNSYLTLKWEIMLFEIYHIRFLLQLSCRKYQFGEWKGLLQYQNLQKMWNQGVWTEFEMKTCFCFFRQSWAKGCRQIQKIKRNSFFYWIF